jgi:uncharacterized protein
VGTLETITRRNTLCVTIGLVFQPDGRKMTEPEFLTFEDAPPGTVSVRGYLHVPPNASGNGLVLTHGAGTDCRSPLLVVLATAFSEAGLTVLRCDLPFRQLQPYGPPRGMAERDQQGLRRAVEAMRRRVPGCVFLGGHSYGGRQGSILAASEPGLVDALLLLSYPLHPPKDPAQLRTAHFAALRTPVLFVHGTRDGFGTVDEMRAAMKLIPARTQFFPIERAGHELIAPRDRTDLPKTIVAAFLAFVRARQS